MMIFGLYDGVKSEQFLSLFTSLVSSFCSENAAWKMIMVEYPEITRCYELSCSLTRESILANPLFS